MRILVAGHYHQSSIYLMSALLKGENGARNGRSVSKSNTSNFSDHRLLLSSSKIINSTFAKKSVYEVGGAMDFLDTDDTLINVLVWGNAV